MSPAHKIANRWIAVAERYIARGKWMRAHWAYSKALAALTGRLT